MQGTRSIAPDPFKTYFLRRRSFHSSSDCSAILGLHSRTLFARRARATVAQPLSQLRGEEGPKCPPSSVIQNHPSPGRSSRHQ